jgi:glutamine cyclotransferase
MTFLRNVLFFIACIPFTAWSVQAWSLQQYSVHVTGQKPQPREHFVQGLEILDGNLYVSTGNYGESHLLRYNFADGRLDQKRKLNARIFAEGVTVMGDKVYQLTWRNRVMLTYRKSDLVFQGALAIKGEGWGLTHNGTELIYSDGSEHLYFMSPDTAKILRTITVTEQGQPLRQLNELEWIEGSIWANVWQSNRIVIIDPKTGEVTANIDLQGLLPPQEHRPDTDVLNGIARDPADGSIWVTGKRWPWLYQIELVPTEPDRETQQNILNSR